MSAKDHREERQFEIVLHLSAEFDAGYEGDEDGYAWHELFQRELKPRLVAQVIDALRAHPRFRARPAPRGRDPEHAVEIDVELVQK